MYVSIFGDGGSSNGMIIQLNLSDGSIINGNWASGLNGPVGFVIDGRYMYVCINIG